LSALSEPAAQAAIQAACKVLSLPTVRAQAQKLAAAAARERLSHTAFLAEVLAVECDERAIRRRMRRVNEAKFPRAKRLEDLDLDLLPGLPAATLAELARGPGSSPGNPWSP
jgi:DNA replication protein DnaC